VIARAAALLLAGTLAACAAAPEPAALPARDRVILLPGSDGTVGAVTVRQGANQAVLDAPYTSASAAADGTLQVEEADAAATRNAFAAALSALPPAPASFVVYFVFGQDELTDESRKAIAPLLDAMARRPAPEITVIGHADRVGAEQVNAALSAKRAERVKEMLVQRGIPAARIVAAGRGSREPLIQGADGVAEPRNRRVEITVR
jgi:outer membrane protein OmpA-like peptidoglycan-associated protein